MKRKLLLLLAAALLAPALAPAAGMSTHLFMTKLALVRIDQYWLHTLLLFNEDLTVVGSVSPDFGSALKRLPGKKAQGAAISAEAHSPEFFEAYWQVAKQRCAPNYYECVEIMPHVFGLAAHNLEDDVYNELFQREVIRRDLGGGKGEDLDGVLDLSLIELYNREKYYPDYSFPADAMVETYAARGLTVTAKDLLDGARVHELGLHAERLISRSTFHRQAQRTPWAVTHLYSAPGGVLHASDVALAHWYALWEELDSGRDAPLVLGSYPQEGGTLEPEGVVAVWFNRGVRKAGVDAASFTLYAPDGSVVPGQVACRTKRPDAEFTRLCSIEPESPLAVGKGYRLLLKAGVADIRGGRLEQDFSRSFAVIPE